jgi:hypothetical protein
MTPVFHPNETISSIRLHLSAIEPSAVAAMPWLESSLAPDWTADDLTQALGSKQGVLISDAHGVALGIAIVDTDAIPDATCIPFLAIDPSRRFRGLGGEAGLAIERHVRSRLGETRFYAPIPDGRGLAVYFWLRLGYRPLLASESPGPLIGLTSEPPAGIWMLRDND